VAAFMGVENILAGHVTAVRPDGRVAVSAGDREFTGIWTGAEPPAIGQPASLLLRAEKVRLGPRSTPAAAALPARVTASVYKGKYTDTIVDTPVGAIQARLWDQELPDTGDLEASWPEASAHVAPEDAVD